MIRSALVTSSPASDKPAMTPISQALPADPPPPRTNARPAMASDVVEMKCGVEEDFELLMRDEPIYRPNVSFLR
jgi:hypothetical protein